MRARIERVVALAALFAPIASAGEPQRYPGDGVAWPDSGKRHARFDANGDGRDDLVMSTSTGVDVRAGAGFGNFPSAASSAALPGVTSLGIPAILDVDDDGRDDAVFVRQGFGIVFVMNTG